MSKEDPVCWHAGEPEECYRMIAGHFRGTVTMKIMGDTLAADPASARAFAADLIAAADELERPSEATATRATSLESQLTALRAALREACEIADGYAPLDDPRIAELRRLAGET